MSETTDTCTCSEEYAESRYSAATVSVPVHTVDNYDTQRTSINQQQQLLGNSE